MGCCHSGGPKVAAGKAASMQHFFFAEPDKRIDDPNFVKTIAEEYKVQWEVPDLDLSEEQLETSAMPAPSGYSVPVAPGSGLEAVYERAPVPPPSPPPPVAICSESCILRFCRASFSFIIR